MAMVAARKRFSSRPPAEKLMISRALGSAPSFLPVILYTSVLAAFGAAYVFLMPKDDDSRTVLIGAVLGTAVVMVLLSRVFKPRRRDAQLAWLEALPFAIDRDHYLEQLATKRTTSQVSLAIDFARPVPAGERDAVLQAVAGAVETSGRAWSGDRLELASPALQTHFTASEGGGTYNNRAVHAWFRGCVEAALATVHPRYPVAAVTVSVAG